MIEAKFNKLWKGLVGMVERKTLKSTSVVHCMANTGGVIPRDKTERRTDRIKRDAHKQGLREVEGESEIQPRHYCLPFSQVRCYAVVIQI